MANIPVWTRERRLQAELHELERICLEWADDPELALSRDGMILLAAGYGAAADAIGSRKSDPILKCDRQNASRPDL